MEYKIARTPKEWRARLNLTQDDVAKALGIHRTTYSSWERNPQKMEIEEGVALADVFGCDFSEIIFFKLKPNKMLDIERDVS
ncbi:helix-turn-helix transcriptional regulator [Bacillus sp. WMMC1349]|uniref:helix-turn-helix transcriptional regulator n=1 Tax=Bacillus sp. WMMC1349 TaxID=2736254 RepID=UPI001553C5FC|nr:helix-turn-helix transcriptional regulator [Bacillus sp. WMMC1349]NPC90986.1 helix-turn-helix transcriptional regulator [Bacillus sp. WMMC1349]NPC91031.1 helix-turn-helix transcriptional regulator [Bacillus sp. WMMC1349]NPC94970.1 helix-turn-helix transcriptional regulator [Bacillus sp. WMMC1349]NPC95042.1 helix-turn-helix transcriptional regulator [Bacillus sp. WMMC1349]NPC95076.1 helix-turn-helix transcriptional regulator [Bacillus sp. WMMC1349]